MLSSHPKSHQPRTLWTNADIITLDDERPRATALVTEGERLVFVGDSAGARAAAGQTAVVENLAGRTVVPGFNDNHLHLVIFGDRSYCPDLTGLNENQIIDVMKGFAEKVPGNSLLIGYSWDYPSCPCPTKERLDEAFPDRPVALSQFGGHAQWVNSVTLRRMGIDRYRSPKHGQVLRDETGEPTGILREVTDNSVTQRHFFQMFLKRALCEPRVRHSLGELRKLGITSVQDNSWFRPVLSTLNKLRKTGELSARVSCWAYGRVPASVPLMNLGPYAKGWIRKGPRKFFLDGTFTTRTAWMDEAYPGFPNDHGMGFDPAWLKTVLEQLVRERVQGAFHSIGDRSTATFLDVWQTVVDRHPEAVDLRMRLEHVQVIRAGDFERMKQLGVCAAAQPPALNSPEKDAEILGRERAAACYPHRSFLKAGVPLSFGSDIPGEAFCDPLRAIHLVCNRSGQERLTPLEALTAYTKGSAYVEFQEHEKGTIKPGFLADFAVLSEDPTADPSRLSHIRVERTVVGGRTMWSSAD
jgi:predicted amidohydrolase YtcJ